MAEDGNTGSADVGGGDNPSININTPDTNVDIPLSGTPGTPPPTGGDGGTGGTAAVYSDGGTGGGESAGGDGGGGE